MRALKSNAVPLAAEAPAPLAGLKARLHIISGGSTSPIAASSSCSAVVACDFVNVSGGDSRIAFFPAPSTSRPL